MKSNFLIFLCLLLFAPVALLAECESVECKTTRVLESEGLKSFSKHNYTWWGFAAYEIEFFIPEKNEQQNLLKTKPKALKLTYHRAFSAADFIKSGAKVLQDNSLLEQAEYSNCLLQFDRLYRAIQPGESYLVLHTSSDKLKLFWQGQELGEVCDSRFAEIYMSIWLSREYSLDSDLQQHLTGNFSNTTEVSND